VHPDWKHPTEINYARGRAVEFVPLMRESYREASEAWVVELATWTPSDEDGARFPWEDGALGPHPDDENEPRMPYWPEAERTAWCVYESVTDGTPISPVFKTRDELVAWLMQPAGSDPLGTRWGMQGLSREAAEKFASPRGWIPSGAISDGRALSVEEMIR